MSRESEILGYLHPEIQSKKSKDFNAKLRGRQQVVVSQAFYLAALILCFLYPFRRSRSPYHFHIRNHSSADKCVGINF